MEHRGCDGVEILQFELVVARGASYSLSLSLI